MPCGSRKSCCSIRAIPGPGLLGLVDSMFSAGCGLGEIRVYFTFQRRSKTPSVPVPSLSSLSRPCRGVPVPVVPVSSGRMSRGPCLVWSGRLGLVAFPVAAAVASLADNFFGEILAASLDPSRRGIYPVVLPPLQLAEPPAHHLCFIKWTSRLILRPRPRAGKPARGEAPQQQPRLSATIPAATTLRRRRARRRTRRSTRRSVLPTPTRWRWRTKGKRGQLRRGRTPPHPRR